VRVLSGELALTLLLKILTHSLALSTGFLIFFNFHFSVFYQLPTLEKIVQYHTTLQAIKGLSTTTV
jgi:hypothetical protein